MGTLRGNEVESSSLSKLSKRSVAAMFPFLHVLCRPSGARLWNVSPTHLCLTEEVWSFDPPQTSFAEITENDQWLWECAWETEYGQLWIRNDAVLRSGPKKGSASLKLYLAATLQTANSKIYPSQCALGKVLFGSCESFSLMVGAGGLKPTI